MCACVYSVRRENIKGKERQVSSAPLIVWNSLGNASYSKPSEIARYLATEASTAGSAKGLHNGVHIVCVCVCVCVCVRARVFTHTYIH